MYSIVTIVTPKNNDLCKISQQSIQKTLNLLRQIAINSLEQNLARTKYWSLSGTVKLLQLLWD